MTTLQRLVEVSAGVRRTASRSGKTHQLADFLRSVDAADREAALRFLSGRVSEGRLGIGPTLVEAALRETAGASTPTLTIDDVVDAAARIGELISGAKIQCADFGAHVYVLDRGSHRRVLFIQGRSSSVPRGCY